MQDLVAGVEKIRFDLEADVEQQRGAQPLPFPGMGKLRAAVCNGCVPWLGVQCPFQHVSGAKMVVCKRWLCGLRKKGDGCDFLHEYDATKMPECYCFSKFGPLCKYKHTRRLMCANYLVGFCPEGPKCKFMQYVLGGRGTQHDVPPMETTLPATGTTQHLCSLEQGTCVKVSVFGTGWAGSNGLTLEGGEVLWQGAGCGIGAPTAFLT
uniref:Cleavage and polyadenylation specificity factor subunit 4 n=1 Tax=Falco tinnunculus TaxID=100819 RepID=A0A8C4TSL0_FALTI